MNKKTIARFWEKVNKTETCWIWKASKRHKGYGAFVWCNNGEVVQGRAHRFSWEIHNGEIPRGFCVLHKCDTPACVNPDHLFLGTKAENNADMHKKGRNVPGGTHCKGAGKYPKGEDHPNAKLCKSSVVAIREDKDSGMSYSAIAKKYKIGIATAWKICQKRIWAHV
jgi:hypothetical protein